MTILPLYQDAFVEKKSYFSLPNTYYDTGRPFVAKFDKNLMEEIYANLLSSVRSGAATGFSLPEAIEMEASESLRTTD